MAANRLYDNLWGTRNLFQPLMHRDETTFLANGEGRLEPGRHHDKAKPPFDRLCSIDVLTQEKREKSAQLRDQTDPRRLKREVYDLPDQILAMPCADTCDSFLFTQGGRPLVT